MRSGSSLTRLALVATIVAVATSCSRDRGRVSVDAGDREIVRVVSLSPSTTETLFAIGAGPLVVGRSRFCDTPPEARALPSVGGYTDPSYEAIFALTPTLVVGARGPAGPRLEARLREHHVATFFPETESVAQIEGMIVDLGRAVGREAAARAVATETHTRIERVAARVRGRPTPRVLMLFDVEPIVAAGPSSFPDDLLARAGAKNAVTEGGPYPVLGLERVLALDPDVVIDTTAAASHAKTGIDEHAPGWSKLRAVREHRVVALRDESVLRPGPRIADAVETLAKVIHPDVAGDGASRPSGNATTSATAIPIAPAK